MKFKIIQQDEHGNWILDYTPKEKARREKAKRRTLPTEKTEQEIRQKKWDF